MENIESKWKHSIEKMSEYELWSVLNKDDEYDTALLKLVHSKSKELFTPSTEEIRNTIISILKELECPFEMEDEVINFEYRNEKFAMIVDDDSSFIQLLKLDVVTISMEDFKEVARLKSAINTANTNGHITVRYSVNDSAGELSVYGSTLVLIAPFVPNRKEYLQFLLMTFLHVQTFLRRGIPLQNEEQHDDFLN